MASCAAARRGKACKGCVREGGAHLHIEDVEEEVGGTSMKGGCCPPSARLTSPERIRAKHCMVKEEHRHNSACRHE